MSNPLNTIEKQWLVNTEITSKIERMKITKTKISTETYLGPGQASMVRLFSENN